MKELRIWRWVRIPVAVIMTLCLWLVYIGQTWHPAHDFLAYGSRTATPRQGNFRAVYISKSCDTAFGGGEEYINMVVLRRRDGRGPDTKIFVYTPTYDFEPIWKPRTHDPVLVWLSANELEISVGPLDEIYTQLREAQGVNITYHIGDVVRQ